MSGTFAAIVATTIFCQSGEPVRDDRCGDAPANKVEMMLLTGQGVCNYEFDCGTDVTEILRIERDGKVVLTVPASAVDRETIEKLWIAVKPMFDHAATK